MKKKQKETCARLDTWNIQGPHGLGTKYGVAKGFAGSVFWWGALVQNEIKINRHLKNINTIIINSTITRWEQKLTPVLLLEMRLSCPDDNEKDIFRSPGPTSTVSFWGGSITERYLLPPVPNSKILLVWPTRNKIE